MRRQADLPIDSTESGHRPLAARMRPASFADFVGQQHLLGPGRPLHRLLTEGITHSMVLWGPPGSGKTTFARIIARETGVEFVELSAVTSGKADVTRVIEHARANQRLGMRTILFVDEIHRFNKAQQDAFLPHVEDGSGMPHIKLPGMESIGVLCRVAPR